MFDNFTMKILGSVIFKSSGEEAKEEFIECEDEQEPPHALPNVVHSVDS